MKKNNLIKKMLSFAMAGTLFASGAVNAHAEDVSNYSFTKPDEDASLTLTMDELHKMFDDQRGAGKIVILSTNDNHGAIQDFAYVAGLKKYLTDQKANVILTDSGDFGSDKDRKDGEEPAEDKGEGHLKNDPINAVRIMNAVGYDVACLGNHEIQSGYSKVQSIIDTANFKIIDANLVFSGGNDPQKKDELQHSANYTKEFNLGNDKITIGFFGLDTKEVQENVKNWNKGPPRFIR